MATKEAADRRDERITLAEAAERFPRRNGRSLTVKAIRRRVRQGVNGVLLRAESDGRRWFTTPRWIEEFLAESTARRTGGVRYPDSAGDEEALEYLARHGIL